MAYRKLNHIDDKIVKATISLAGTPESRKGFATKDIAERCRVSEYVIFKHFINKQNLMIVADKEVMNAFANGAASLQKQGLDFPGFFNRFLDFLLAHKDLTFFALNFGHGIPHAADTPVWENKEYESFLKKNAIAFLDPILQDENTPALAWDFFMRNCLYFAGFILFGEWADNPDNRKLMFSLVSRGIRSFTAEAQA
jgi:AcrR family transcriptional regulator